MKVEGERKFEALDIHLWRMVGGREKIENKERKKTNMILSIRKLKFRGYLRHFPNLRGNLRIMSILGVYEENFLRLNLSGLH